MSDITDKKQAEEELSENCRFIQSLTNTMPSVLYLYDLIEQRNVYANTQTSTLFGYTEREIQEMGATLFERMMHPDDFARMPEHVAKFNGAVGGQIIENEYRMRDRGGGWRWISGREIVYSRADDGRPKLILGTAHDITDRKRAEEARDLSDDRFAKAFRAIPDAALIIRQSDGLILDVNDGWEMLSGYTRVETVGRTALELELYIRPEDREGFFRVMREQKSARDLEADFRTRAGGVRHVAVSGELFGGDDEPSIIAIIRDITDKKQVAEAEHAAYELLQFTIDSLSANITILNERADIIAVNNTWRRYADNNEFRGPQYGIGLNYLKVCEAAGGSAEARKVAGGLRAVMDGVRGEFSYVYSCAPPQSKGWFVVHVRRFEVNGAVHIVVSHDDVTHLKLAEEELYQLSARLLVAQDEERRRIARELHDGTAQNLFGVSLNLAALQQQSRSLPGDLRDIISDCQSLCDKSLHEIRMLSYLLHPPLLEEAGLAASLRWFLDGFIKRSDIYVELIIPQDFGRLPVATELALFRVVQEALTNVFRHAASDTAAIHLEKVGEEVVLRIKDSGRGMPRQSWLTGAENSDSLGVGIPGMRQRLRRLGGRLEITSNSKGTTVTAVAPLGGERNVKDSIGG